MMRTWRALIWLRFRKLANGLQGGRRRDSLERASRTLSVIVWTLGALFVLGASIGFGILGWLGGRFVASGDMRAASIVAFLRLGLALLLAILVLSPLGRSMHARESGATRLALLPVSRRALHLAQLSAGLLDPWVLPVIPLLLLFPAGLAAEGKTLAALLGWLAAVAFLWALAAAASLASLGMQAFLRRRGRTEVAALLFFGCLSLAGMIPAMLQGKLEVQARNARTASPADFERSIPAIARILPSEIYGGAVRAALDGRTGRSLAFAGGLLALAALLTTASGRLHAHLLDSPEGERTRRRAPARNVDAARWPGLSVPATAVARVQIRSVVRTLRGKFALFFTGPLVALLSVMMRRAHGGALFHDFISRHGTLALSGAAFMAISTAQPLLANLFAVDKAGLTRQFLAPISDRDLLVGKLAGGGVLFAGTLLLCYAGIALVLPGGSPLLWLCGLVGGASVYLAMAPLLAILSMAFPKASDLNKMGNPGNPHAAAALTVTLCSLLACAPPSLLLAVGGEMLELPWITLGATILWALLAGLIARLSLGPLSRALGERRENLGLVAERR